MDQSPFRVLGISPYINSQHLFKPGKNIFRNFQIKEEIIDNNTLQKYNTKI